MPETISIPFLNLEARIEFTPQEHPSEPPESIEILGLWIGTHELDARSEQALLYHVSVYYDPMLAGEPAKDYSIADIIDFEVKKHIRETKSDREFEGKL